MENVAEELAENWPAFTYILMTAAFSVLFFRERRTERKDIGERFDRLEDLVRGSPRNS